MAADAPSGSDAADAPSSGWDLRERVRRLGERAGVSDPTLAGLVVVTVLSLATRLVGLGSRVAQWDEGRVAYWALRYQETGAWEYRPIVHGPFLFHVDRFLFSVFGASDVTMRVIVALIGGLLPLGAWLFREHLRDAEVVALGLLFAANPLLIYYSRFFRNDVLVATFMLFALGFFVRTYDTRQPRYLYAGVVCFALGFTTKENALVYPLCWLGAAALLLDHRLFRVSERARRVPSDVERRARSGLAAVADGGSPDDQTDPGPDGDDAPDAPEEDADGEPTGEDPDPAEGEGDVDSADADTPEDDSPAGEPAPAVRSAPDHDVGTLPTDGPDGTDDPFDFVVDRLRPYAERVAVPAAIVVVLLNPYVLSAVGSLLTSLFVAAIGAGVPTIGFVTLAPVGLAAGGLALVTALERPDSPQAYVAMIASYLPAFGLWGLGAGPDVATVTYVLVYGLWLALLADVLLFDDGEALSGAVPVSYALFFAVVVFFYAPRAGETGGLGLYAVVDQPRTAPAVVHAAVIGSWEKFLETWAASSHQEHAYLPFFVDYLERLRAVGAVTACAAVLGFVYDRYSTDGPRDLVSAGAYWGGASVLGYPLITDIMAPWAVVHALVPLAIPAAVGLALVYRWARAVEVDQPVQATVSVLLVVLVVGWTAGVAYDANFAAPDERKNEAFAHWTQPDNDLRYSLQKIERVADRNEGVDVLFYGSRRGGTSEELFYVSDESFNERPPAAGGWYDRLPLPWYMERYGANVTSTPPEGEPVEKLRDPPPVVVAYAWDRNQVTPFLEGYVMYRHEFKLYSEDILVFVHADYVDSVGTGQVIGEPDATTDRWQAPDSKLAATGPPSPAGN